MIKIHLILLSVILAFSALSAKAQSFSYTSEHSNSSYIQLDTTKETLPSSVWQDQSYSIPIGFSFGLDGQTYTSLTVKTNGLLAFGDENKFNFIFLNKEFLTDVNEANEALSHISYNHSITEDSQRILKIEFDNVGMPTPSSGLIHCSFQIWVREYSNKIEFHMGSIENNAEVNDTYQMGFINMNNTSNADLGFLLQGNASSPTGTQVSAGGNLVSLINLPSAGTTYIFTPAN